MSDNYLSVSSSSREPDGREEDHDPNELEWEAAFRRHAGTFRQFDSIASTARVQWAKDNFTEAMNQHGINRAKFEEDRETWAREKDEKRARHLLELRKEIVRAWMRIEEEEWKKAKETWKQEANTLEREFTVELQRIQAIVPPTSSSTSSPKMPGPPAIPPPSLSGLRPPRNPLVPAAPTYVHKFF